MLKFKNVKKNVEILKKLKNRKMFKFKKCSNLKMLKKNKPKKPPNPKNKQKPAKETKPLAARAGRNIAVTIGRPIDQRSHSSSAVSSEEVRLCRVLIYSSRRTGRCAPCFFSDHDYFFPGRYLLETGFRPAILI